MKHLIAVAHAGAIKTPGFGRVELVHVQAEPADAIFEDRCRREHALIAAVYRVAAEIHGIAGAELLEPSVIIEAKRGVINIDFRAEAFGADVIDEILIEACANAGLEPIDLLVESGAIDPTV